jgi:hypothetical protein
MRARPGPAATLVTVAARDRAAAVPAWTPAAVPGPAGRGIDQAAWPGVAPPAMSAMSGAGPSGGQRITAHHKARTRARNITILRKKTLLTARIYSAKR